MVAAGIHDPVGVLPRDGPDPPRPGTHGCEKESSRGQARYGSSRSPAQPTAPCEPGCRQEQDSRGRQRDVENQPDFEAMGRADLDEYQTEDGAGRQQRPGQLFREPAVPKDGAQDRGEPHRKQDSNAGVEQHAAPVEDGRRRKCIQINRGKSENQDETQPPATHYSLTPAKIW